MKMKKFMSIALTLALALSAVGCGSKAPEQPKDETQTNGDVATGEVSKLTYLAWDVGTEEDPTLERAMIEIYDEEHPEVEIEILAVPEGTDYNSYIATLASSGQMPDVFMWGSVTDSILNGWAADVSEYALNDEAYKLVNTQTTEGGQVNGKVFGIPKSMHYMGMYINKNIFEANNVAPLEFGYTMDELMNAIEKNTTATTKGVDNFAVEAWYPMTVNPAYGIYTYDGEKANLDSEEFAAGIEFAQKATQNNWNMANTSPLEFFGAEGWAWGGIGGIAIQYDGTWNLTSLADQADFKYDFIGLPGGHTVLVNDYLFVSDASSNKEEAYELAKWLGFSTEGILERFAIVEESGAYTYNSIPLVTTNDEINEKFLATVVDYPEFSKAYEAFATSPELLHVEGYKEIAGFPTAIFTADTGVQGTNADGTAYSMNQEQLRNAVIKGQYKLSDYATKMNDIANHELEAIRTQLEEATK
ncbi:MAG: ABC transporter substrate-binding protein [Cellulosilyticaceae bacterium]